MTEKIPEFDVAARYIRENFEPFDRLAVVLLNKRTSRVAQRIGLADKIADAEYQAWLHRQNNSGYEIYISMNALRPDAKGRTKADIGAIRHIYLDLDQDGTAAIQSMQARSDIPRPNYLIRTSPGKWQVIWKAEGFTKGQAEGLQKSLAVETGADPAATDCARVLRLPGFYNHKYAPPHLVTVQAAGTDFCRPEHFPDPAIPARVNHERFEARVRRGVTERALSQSERDWAFAKRALARGEDPVLVASAIASYRRFDKQNPLYYADLTVKKAGEALRSESQEPARW